MKFYLILPAEHLTARRQKKAQREKKSNMKENNDQNKVIKVITWGETNSGGLLFHQTWKQRG